MISFELSHAKIVLEINNNPNPVLNYKEFQEQEPKL